MTIRPRWKKLWRDLQSAYGRMLMIVVAIAVSILAVGTILSAYTILTREVSRNYLGTNPAAAWIEVDMVDEALVQAVRQHPLIADAEAGAILSARAEIEPDRWLPMTIFVTEDFNAMRISTFQPEAGAWPPPSGSILVERTALPLTGSALGEPLRVQIGNHPQREVVISGLTHDPGLAPAWQEQTIYAYTTPATVALLQGDSPLSMLKITLQGNPSSVATVEEATSQVVAWLKTQGRAVGEIRVPPPGRHPHQGQMNAILLMFLLFSLMALLLSGVLTATLIGGMLAQQVRQLGMMKAIGARSRQIAAIYLVLVALLGGLAVALGMPLGVLAGRGLAGVVAQLLNLTLYSETIPWWVFAIQVIAGVLLPLLITLVPIVRFARTTVRESLQDFGVSSAQFGTRSFDSWLSQLRFFNRGLLFALRNAFRRRTRLLLTLSLLSLAGAVFLAALNVRAAWEKNLADAASDRRYDLEIRLNQAQPEAEIVPLIAQVAGVAKVETWNFAAAAAFREDGLDVVRTYPDGGHASFTLRSRPVDSNLVRLRLLTGRLLQPGELGSVVLNHSASTRFPAAQVGQRIRLNANQQTLDLLVVGIVRELLTPATAYVTPETFASAFTLASQGPGQTNALRIVFDEETKVQADIGRAIEQTLSANQVDVKLAISEALLAEALDGHVLILIVMLLAMALIMALVGLLGLTSAISSSVVERTREFGVMRAIGARSRTIQRNVITESLLIGLMSWGVAIVLSLPLSLLVGRLIGRLAFGLPLPLVVSPIAILAWLLLIGVGSLVASLYPAQSAARLTVRETLAYV